MPDAADWVAFARQLRAPPEPPPAAPPSPQTLPIAGDVGLGGSGDLEFTPALAARAVAGGAAAAMALATVFWIGQGLRLAALAGSVERQARAERSAAAPLADDAAARQRLAAYRALADRPDPLAGLAGALEVLRAHGVAASSFAVAGPVLTVTAPYAALGRVDAITAALEATGDFQEVRPLPDSAAGLIRIELTLRGAAAPGPSPN
jgi:hypothetical protein